ncbi:MAG: pyridoxamine 5'-phosphate oxidase [Aquihabitans sp.]
MSPDIGGFREQYNISSLRRADLAGDPATQFQSWWDAWMATTHYDPAACVLATADAQGRPSARYVLCRHVDADGFVIYTNLESHKASDMAANPYAALVFGWLDMNRQVRVEGRVAEVDDAVADAYWVTRPRGSQIGAWASDQSKVLVDRAELERNRDEAIERFGADESDDPIPRPAHWSGLSIALDRVEFWQGRPDRLHDRFEYRRPPDGSDSWEINRLAP